MTAGKNTWVPQFILEVREIAVTVIRVINRAMIAEDTDSTKSTQVPQQNLVI